MIWEDLLRAMATLCLTVALAAAVAAAILLVKEELSDRLGSEIRSKSGRKTGLLALLAVGVWIMVIGQNVSAAEAGGGSTSEIAAEAEPGSDAGATEAAPTGMTESASAGATEAATTGTTEAAPAGTTDAAPEGTTEASTAGTTQAAAAGTNEQAEPVEPEPVDTMAPTVDIQLTKEAAEDEQGNVYCRADNAGLRIVIEEDREEDSGLANYRITVTDREGNEFLREMPADGDPRRIEEEISTEEVAALADGPISVHAEAVDTAGNREEKEFSYILDTINPKLTAEISQPTGNPGAVDESAGLVYYGKNREHYGGGKPQITVSFTVTDQNIDRRRILPLTAYTTAATGENGEVIVPDQSITVDLPGSSYAAKSAAEESAGSTPTGQVPEDSTLNLQIVRNPGEENTPDGVYRFGIEGTDKAGNPLILGSGEKEDELRGVVCEDKERGTFYTGRKVVDTVSPEGELQIQDPSGTVYCRMEQHGRIWSTDRDSFMPYRREKEAVVCLSASDASPVSASCRILSTADKQNRSSRQADEANDHAPDGSEYASPCRIRVGIRGAQVFRIENLVFRDRAGNESAPLQRTVNLYLDRNLPWTDIDAPSVSVRILSAGSSMKADGRPLYADQVTLEITAEDPDRAMGDSGLKEVRCEVEIDARTVRSEILFGAGSQAPDPDAEEIPVYQYKGRFTIPSGGQWESNDIVVRVTAEDNAGNRSDPQIGGIFRLGIDTTRPEVTVRYDNNDIRNGMYLNGKRTALITVRERNFDKGALRIDAPGAQIGEWVLQSTEEWTSEVRFDADGVYTLDVGGTDAAGNPASVDYVGAAVRRFVIDRTPPRIEVFWDNTDVRNGRYYNRPRRATVRITDVSFDETRVKILPFSKGFHKAGAVRTPPVEAPAGDDRYSTEETVYEMNLPFTEEGEWMLSCACTDLAGNTAVPVSEPSFVLDFTGPRLFFDRETVQEKGDYGDALSPKLRWEEENPSPGAGFAMWSNVSAGGQAMECRKVSSGAAVLPDLPQEREADGLCMLYGTACDLAGNRTFIRRNVRVNRFGSLYDLSEDEGTLEMIGKSYTSAEHPFVAAEYNVSPLVTRQVTLYRNGTGRILRENREYTVTETSGRNGWKYIYRIDPSAFSEEGKYSLLFESDDAAGRHNSSPGKFKDEGIGSPEWVVDRTPPTVRLPDADPDENRFVTDAVVLSLIPEDNMELAKLTIRITDDRGNLIEEKKLGGEELAELLDHSRGEVPVEIKASGKWQTISAAAEDSAGNQSSGLLCANNDSEITGYRLLVSSNILVHLYRSGILPAAALLVLAAAFWVKTKWIQMFTKTL